MLFCTSFEAGVEKHVAAVCLHRMLDASWIGGLFVELGVEVARVVKAL